MGSSAISRMRPRVRTTSRKAAAKAARRLASRARRITTLPLGKARAAASGSGKRASSVSSTRTPELWFSAALASFARDKDDAMSIPDNLAAILARIDAARKAALNPAPLTRLVAVSKTVDEPGIRAALAAGQRLFGENRVQEAQAKFPALKTEFPDLELHLIGPLQSNKVKEAVALFDAIQTLDRVKLAHAVAAERDKSGKCPRLFVQVNTGEEPQKAGVLPKDAAALIAEARGLTLPVAGLMCIPPVEDDAAPHFAFLAKLARENGLDQLSMGMSSDFEMAVRFGATHVRVGTAIFGERRSEKV